MEGEREIRGRQTHKDRRRQTETDKQKQSHREKYPKKSGQVVIISEEGNFVYLHADEAKRINNPK